MEGILVVNKPKGITSHDVVARVRRQFKMKRVGHAGTLDPLATGVLIILVGKATKLFDQFMNFDKGYLSTMRLGMKTDSADTDGKVIAQKSFEDVSKHSVEVVLKKFLGEIDQLPPMFSAVKINGKKLYELARQGIVVERQPRRVRIDCLEVRQFNLPDVQFYMECSKGTYVRQLADEVGDLLGCGACICELQRTKIGSFTLDDAVDLQEINESHIRHWTDSKAV